MNNFNGTGCRNTINSSKNNFQGTTGYVTRKITRKQKTVKNRNKK